MLLQNGIDELIERLERDGNHRVLRRLDIREGRTTDEPSGLPTFIGLVLDVETTGTDPKSDVIIELALRRFRYDSLGFITKIDASWSWREDPGRPLEDEIVRLTGIDDADLVGESIDDEIAASLICSADLIIAHKAAFDRKFVERRLPQTKGRAWACSCKEIDWAASRFDGRSLRWLAAQAGFFYDAHRAANDVDAVIALLGHEMRDGRNALAHLVESAACPTVRVEAFGADFGVKDALRERGYRWNADQKVWWRDVTADELVREEYWLAREVYAPEHRPRSYGPMLTEMTARERYA